MNFVFHFLYLQTSLSHFKSGEFSVKRRFSDFLGLFERLNDKHIVFGRIVPPPPDKSVVGKTEVMIIICISLYKKILLYFITIF